MRLLDAEGKLSQSFIQNAATVSVGSCMQQHHFEIISYIFATKPQLASSAL